MPYYFYYKEQIEYAEDGTSKNITYCTANFPSYEIEAMTTIYTVIISYVLPLMTIIFCYAKMIIKIIKKSKEQIFYDNSSFKTYKKKVFVKGNKKFGKSNESENEMGYSGSLSSNNQVN